MSDIPLLSYVERQGKLSCTIAVLMWLLSNLELIVNQARHYLQCNSEREKQPTGLLRYDMYEPQPTLFDTLRIQ